MWRLSFVLIFTLTSCETNQSLHFYDFNTPCARANLEALPDLIDGVWWCKSYPHSCTCEPVRT